MRVLMVGRGVIATVYGWAFAQAGHEVEFLVRPGRAATYGGTVDIDVLDARRRALGERVTRSWRARLIEELAPDHDVDLVVLSVGHHQLSAASASLAPRVGTATVLVFGNVWDDPAAAVAPLPLDQVVWGFPQAGGGFDDDGVLHAALMRRVVLGTSGQGSRRQAVREAFTTAGFTVSDQPDIRGWLLLHLVADAGMHAQGLRLGSLSRMIGRPRAFRDALLTSRELLPVLTARGVDLRRHRGTALLFRAPARLVAGAMALATAHVPIARTSLAAHTDPYAAEPRRVVLDVLAEAHRLGVPATRLAAAGALL